MKKNVIQEMAKSLIPYIRALSCWYICLYSPPQSWSCCRCACIHHSWIVRIFLSLNWSRNEAVCLCRDQLSLVEGKRCPRFPFLELQNDTLRYNHFIIIRQKIKVYAFHFCKSCACVFEEKSKYWNELWMLLLITSTFTIWTDLIHKIYFC